MATCARRKQLGLATALAAAIGRSLSLGQDKGDSLERGFQSPPDTAKPRVWWHWMNGNITKEGIDSDLDWMKRVGIGGGQKFGGAPSTPEGGGKQPRFICASGRDACRVCAEKSR